jgi:hypothetical protein
MYKALRDSTHASPSRVLRDSNDTCMSESERRNIMNITYLETLPEVANKYKVYLQADEKVVFTAKLSTFGTETDRMLGNSSKFSLTNKRIIVDNVWTVDILDDVAGCTKIVKRGFVFEFACFSVALNKEIIFNGGVVLNKKVILNGREEKMNGFHFYFNKKDTVKFEEIMNNLFN